MVAPDPGKLRVRYRSADAHPLGSIGTDPGTRMLHPLPLVLLACLSATAAEPAPPFHFAYYLFADAHAEGCSPCYVPLLVTRAALASGGAHEVAVIETYERDSIWRLRPDLASLQPPQGDDVLTRTLDWEGRRYRYQLVSSEEVLRLLRAPEGRIAIHRLEEPVRPEADAVRNALLRDLDTTHAP